MAEEDWMIAHKAFCYGIYEFMNCTQLMVDTRRSDSDMEKKMMRTGTV
jgi:hypothetical protein